MRASLVCVALGIAQVASLEPRRWCTRCHVHLTAVTNPNVLGQTTHHWVDRHDRAVECAHVRPRILVLAAPPRAQLQMKLGSQEVRTALRRAHTRLAGGVARVRTFVGSAYVSSLRALTSHMFPFLSAEADEVLSKGAVDAWSVRMSRFATIALIGSVLQTVLLLFIGPAIFTKDPTVAVSKRVMVSLSQAVMWLNSSPGFLSACWLAVYFMLWTKIEDRVFWEFSERRLRDRRKREEARREDEANRRRWEEEFKQWIGSISTPNLGWALEALEIDTLEGLTLRQAQAAFHKVAKRCHPDVTGQASSAEQFKDINEAYDAIKQHLQSSGTAAA